MSISGLSRAMDDTRFHGAHRLAWMAIGDCDGIVSLSSIMKWANVDEPRAVEIVQKFTRLGLCVQWLEGLVCPELLRVESDLKPKVPAMSSRTRRAVFDRDGEKCRYCGCEDGPFHLDHVLPQSRGGTHDVGNLVVACATCNIRKKARTPEEMGWTL